MARQKIFLFTNTKTNKKMLNKVKATSAKAAPKHRVISTGIDLSKFVYLIDVKKESEGLLSVERDCITTEAEELAMRYSETGTFEMVDHSGARILVCYTDKYKTLTEEEVKLLPSHLRKRVEEKTVFSFNPTIVEKHFDAICAALEGVDMPQEDKEVLVQAKTTITLSKGTKDIEGGLPYSVLMLKAK